MVMLSAVQMVSGCELKKNLATAKELIAQAAAQKSRLVVLPENFAFMGKDEADKLALQEAEGVGQIQNFLRECSKEYGVYLIGGTMPMKSDDRSKVFSACLVFNDRGEQIARYNKIHLFDVSVSAQERYLESSSVMPGNELVLVTTPFGSIGLTVCYDLRFPELYRQLSEKGADIFVVPSAFTYTTGLAHWEVLLRARAIENLSCVVAPNQGGIHDNGRRTWGNSMIIDYWGRVLASRLTEAGVVCADFDKTAQEKQRTLFPVLTHRQLR